MRAPAREQRRRVLLAPAPRLLQLPIRVAAGTESREEDQAAVRAGQPGRERPDTLERAETALQIAQAEERDGEQRVMGRARRLQRQRAAPRRHRVGVLPALQL